MFSFFLLQSICSVSVSNIWLVFCDQQQFPLTLFEASCPPFLEPSICLHLSALMNSPGRLERRHDGLKEAMLGSNLKNACNPGNMHHAAVYTLCPLQDIPSHCSFLLTWIHLQLDVSLSQRMGLTTDWTFKVIWSDRWRKTSTRLCGSSNSGLRRETSWFASDADLQKPAADVYINYIPQQSMSFWRPLLLFYSRILHFYVKALGVVIVLRVSNHRHHFEHHFHFQADPPA